MERQNVKLSDWKLKAEKFLPASGFGNCEENIIIAKGQGSHVWDENGKKYIDYLIGSGPMLLGHGNPEVLEAVYEQLPNGTTFFANNSKGIELAEAICEAVACCEKVRFVASGSEADMYAMRLARAFTGKNKIIKFEGGYHGMSSEAQMSLSPTNEVNFPQSVPDSAGIPSSVENEVLIAPFNDLIAVENIMNENQDIAAVIVEPLQRIIPPIPGFLTALKGLCKKKNILLIFDEIVTGFRLAYGGAQEHYNVVPDICTLGKIIGGGFPLAAIGASADIMKHFDKGLVKNNEWLMQIGTLSGNPIAAVAGLKTMEILKRPGNYDKIKDVGKRLQLMQSKYLSKAGINHKIVGEETLFDIIFTDKECIDYRTTKHQNPDYSKVYNQILLDNGILKSPSKIYPSLAITDADLEETELAVEKAVGSLSNIL